MTTWVWIAIAVMAVVTLYLSWTAGRVDRLHTRLEAARSALDAQLSRRGSVALEAATCGVLDPATSLLVADAALRARAAGDGGNGSNGTDDGGGSEVDDGGPVRGGLGDTGEPMDADRETAESNLSRTLAAAFPDAAVVAEFEGRPGAEEVFAELGASCRRVEMARRFHNDTVTMARALRSRRRVRWFRLAGNAPWPQTIELDTTPPPGLR